MIDLASPNFILSLIMLTINHIFAFGYFGEVREIFNLTWTWLKIGLTDFVKLSGFIERVLMEHIKKNYSVESEKVHYKFSFKTHPTTKDIE